MKEIMITSSKKSRKGSGWKKGMQSAPSKLNSSLGTSLLKSSWNSFVKKRHFSKSATCICNHSEKNKTRNIKI